MSSDWKPVILHLPSYIELDYFAEGAGNIVYRIRSHIDSPSPAQGTPPPSELESYGSGTPPPSEVEIAASFLGPEITNKLLRLRKDHKRLNSVLKTHEYHEKAIKPMFMPGEIMEQALVALPEDLVERLNAELKLMEQNGERKSERCGAYLNTVEGFGLLVEDMSPAGYIGDPEDVFCMEFKPKWLVQSGSAPAEARRCRTCALRARRAANKRAASYSFCNGFCPLKLTNEDRSVVIGAVMKMLVEEKLPRACEEGWPPLAEKIVNCLDRPPGNGMLKRLRDLQVRYDPHGVLKADTKSIQYLTARTLMDCSVFLRLSISGNGKSEIKLGDLDLKSPAQADHWILQECQLIDEGWYMLEDNDLAENRATCALMRSNTVQDHRQ